MTNVNVFYFGYVFCPSHPKCNSYAESNIHVKMLRMCLCLPCPFISVQSVSQPVPLSESVRLVQITVGCRAARIPVSCVYLDRISSHLRAVFCCICLRWLHTCLHTKRYVCLLCLFSSFISISFGQIVYMLLADPLCYTRTQKSSHTNCTYLPHLVCQFKTRKFQKSLMALNFLCMLPCK